MHSATRRRLYHRSPASSAQRIGTSYGFATGLELRRYPESIELPGTQELRLVRCDSNTKKSLFQMFASYPDLGETMPIAKQAYDAVRIAGSDLAEAERMVSHFVERRIEGFETGKLISYAIVDVNKEMIGNVSMWPITSPFANAFEIGITVRPDYWHANVGLNVIRAVGAMAIDSLGAQRLEMATDDTNITCRRLCEILGFEDEGPMERLQQGAPSPFMQQCRLFAWTVPQLQQLPEHGDPPAPRRQTRDGKSEIEARAQAAIIEDPAIVKAILDDVKRTLEDGSVGHKRNTPRTPTDESLRAIVSGAASRVLALLTLGEVLERPQSVVQALEYSPALLRYARSVQEGDDGSLEYPKSHFPYGSNEARFHDAILKTFAGMRFREMKGNARYKPLFEMCNDLFPKESDPLADAISDAVSSLVPIYRALPRAAEIARHALPEEERRRLEITNDVLQRAILRSDDDLAEANVHDTSAELIVSMRDPYNMSVALWNAAPVQPASLRRPVQTSTSADFSASTALTYVIAASHDDGKRFHYLPPSATREPGVMSTGAAVRHVAALFAPLLWAGDRNISTGDDGITPPQDLASRRMAFIRDWDTPYSTSQPLWGRGPASRVNVSRDLEQSPGIVAELPRLLT